MFSGTHTIEVGIDGAYIIVRDTTTDAEYLAGTGLPVSELSFVGGLLEIDNPAATISKSYIMTGDDVIATRTGPGLKIMAIDLIGANVIPDDLYEIVLIINLDHNAPYVRQSGGTSMFYGVVHKKLMTAVISTAWKIVYSNKNPYYDNSLKLKSWFDNMKIASDLGFYSESLRLLKALQKVLV
jgi:hypothetical protein